MKCDMKKMLKAGLGLAAIVVVAYAIFPGIRELILDLSPALFLLICPLMMLFMMKGMQSCHHEQDTVKHKAAPIPVSDVEKETSGQR